MAIEPARIRMVSLGALPRLERIRDGTVRVNKHFGSTAQRLQKLQRVSPLPSTGAPV